MTWPDGHEIKQGERKPAGSTVGEIICHWPQYSTDCVHYVPIVTVIQCLIQHCIQTNVLVCACI